MSEEGIETKEQISQPEGFDPGLYAFIADKYRTSPQESEIQGLTSSEIAKKFPSSFVSVDPDNPEAYRKLLRHTTYFLISQNEPGVSQIDRWQRSSQAAEEGFVHELQHLEAVKATDKLPLSLTVRLYKNSQGQAQATPSIFYADLPDNPVEPLANLCIHTHPSPESLSNRDMLAFKEFSEELVRDPKSFWRSIVKNPDLALQVMDQLLKFTSFYLKEKINKGRNDRKLTK